MTQAGIVRGGGEKRSLRGVFKQLHLFFGQADGKFQIPPVELGLVQIEQPLGEERVIVQKGRDGRLALAVAAQQSAGPRIVHSGDEKLRRAAGGGGVTRLFQNGATAREG